MLYIFLASLNATIIQEFTTSRGQVDMTILLGEYFYVMEIKLDKSQGYQPQTPNPALQKMQDKGYAQKYSQEGKSVYEVGLVFNQVQHNLVQLSWSAVNMLSHIKRIKHA